MEYGLIGEKLGHSYSKDIHNQIDNYSYELKEIEKDKVDDFMKAKDFKGINVTIPYKQTVIPYLDEIDEAAKEIGAVNTVVNKKGKLYGYNTDFIGLKRLILSLDLNLEGKKVLILGTGGTSKTARTVAKSLKAGQVIIVSRSEGEGVVTYEKVYESHTDAQIIINTTPSGMYPSIESSPIDLKSFTSLEGVVDAIYNPLRSKLIVEAQNLGAKAQGGLYMLVQQAIAAAEYFFDKPVDGNKADLIYRNLINQKRNIVLVGMPGCGKSTVGKRIAKALNRDFFDTDDVITEKEEMTPSELIRLCGEPAFRDIEAEVCKEMATKTNVVISTGGGAILRPENVVHLKNNGMIFFIDRDIENIRPTGNRPLSDSRDKLKKVYEVRYPIYKACADYHIVSDNNIENTVKTILDAFSGK